MAVEEAAPIPAEHGTRRWIYNSWMQHISSPAHEAVILLSVYLVIRWFKILSSQAVILLISALAVLIKEAVRAYGTCLLRFLVWRTLAKDGFDAWDFPNPCFGDAGAGIVLVGPMIWFMPVYVLSLPWIIIWTLLWQRIPEENPSRSDFWAKFGVFAYENVLTSEHLFRDFYDERMGRPRARDTPFALRLLLVVANVLFIPYTFSIFAVLGIFFITGEHLPICIVVCMEILTTVLDFNLGRFELHFVACYVIPFSMYGNYLFLNRVIPEIQIALQRDLGHDHRLSKLARIYDEIPISESDRAFKIWDTAKGEGAKRSPCRKIRSHKFVYSVHESTSGENIETGLPEFKCWIETREKYEKYLRTLPLLLKKETALAV